MWFWVGMFQTGCVLNFQMCPKCLPIHSTCGFGFSKVKENRLRREKQVEFQRKENALKKAAFLEAQCLVQEEKRRKALLAKKEKEGIQREMVKLRREILERRRTVEEAWKT